MNRRELLQLFSLTGVVGAIGGAAALERAFEPFRAIPPAESGWIVASGISPRAITLQWGKSDAKGLARYPLEFNEVWSVVQSPAEFFDYVSVKEARMQPCRDWAAWGFI